METEISESAQILTSFTTDGISAEECFCLILSLEGYGQTRANFLQTIEVYKLTQPRKYKELFDVFTSYFKQPPTNDFTEPVGASVENGFLTSDLGYELDIELALAQSLADQKLESGSNHSNKSESISRVKSYANVSHTSSNNNLGFSSSTESKNNVRGNKVGSTSYPLDSTAAGQQVVSSFRQGLPPGLNIEPIKPKNKKKKKSSIERPLSSKPVIYWLRRDLRLYDNPALNAAIEFGGSVIFTFLWTEREEDPNNMLAVGGATKLWLHHALESLNDDLVNKYGHGIVYRKTDNTITEMKRLLSETGAKTLVINNVYEPFLSKRDDEICQVLSDRGVTCKRFDSYLLYDPSVVSTEEIGLRGIGSVTHFMECCRLSDTESIGHPVDTPRICPRVNSVPAGNRLEELELAKMPRKKDGTTIDWAAPIRDQWNFGESGAWDALSLFLQEGIRSYEKESCRADNLNTCRISPYLHFGQISPRAVLREAQGMKSPKFLRKLAWRDLSYWLLTLWPEMPTQPIRVHYKDQRWSKNKAHLKAWQKGNTGFPLIDAAMRQLWLTGWINNYMRHAVASFLISYLHIHWIEGYRWFQDTLLDADVAINSMMWQNGGMSGLDQWNFVMHPVDAALTCDPDGDYVRTWCPELAALPNETIHQPWKCPPSIMRRHKVVMGETYPNRIVINLEEAREQSLQDVTNVRRSNSQYIDPRTGSDLVIIGNGQRIPCITRKEFKYKTSNPESEDNPHTAVLRGYRSRKRDEMIELNNQRDFLASTMNECVMRKEREEGISLPLRGKASAGRKRVGGSNWNLERRKPGNGMSRVQ